MEPLLPSDFSSDYYITENTQTLRPMVTVTEDEKTVLPYILALRNEIRIAKAALQASAREISEGVLSAWSYDDLRNDIPSVEEDTTQQFGSQLLSGLSPDSAKTTPEKPPLSSSARLRSKTSKSLEKQNLAVSKTRLSISTDRRRAQIREAQRAFRSRQDSKLRILEEKNRKLHDAIRGMIGSFRSVQEAAMMVSETCNCQGQEEIRHQLQKSTDEFWGFAKTIPDDDGLLSGSPGLAGERDNHCRAKQLAMT